MSDHTLKTRELVVDDNVDSKENLEEKTREVADITMCRISLTRMFYVLCLCFFMVVLVDIIFFILLTFLTKH